MKWHLLKQNKCPKCGKDLIKGFNSIPTKDGLMMTHSCGFNITERRYKQIVSGMVIKDLQQGDETEENETLL